MSRLPLQEWERFVRLSDSGVTGKAMQHSVMLELAGLAHMRDRKLFEDKVGGVGAQVVCRVTSGQQGCTTWHVCTASQHGMHRHSFIIRILILFPHPTCPILQLAAFYNAHEAAHPKLVKNMKDNWESCAQRWAWFGRVSILDLEYNTTNPTERGWGMLKYTHLNRNTQSTIQQLVDTLLGVWVASTMKQRELQLAGRVRSDQLRQAQRVEDIVAELVSSGAVAALDVAGMPGLTAVKKIGGRGDAKACLGDLSCTCRFSSECVKQGREHKKMGGRRLGGVQLTGVLGRQGGVGLGCGGRAGSKAGSKAGG